MGLDISAISDVQAESGVIATLMYHPEFILHTDYIKPGYFYNVENGCLFWAIAELYKNGVDTIDAINITNMLNSNAAVKKKIEEYNLTDIQEFINMAQYAARHTLEEYKLLANNVVTMSFKRELNRVAHEIQSKCFDGESNLDQLNQLVNGKINKLTEQYLTTHDIEMFGTHVDSLWDQICQRRTEDGIYGIPSKFPSLADYFTYENGELILLKARMKRGKSAFFLNEAMHKLKAGVPTLYLDTEMSSRLFYERMLANLTNIDVKRVKNGKYSEEEAKRIEMANEWIQKQPFVHMYLPTTTNEEIYSICKILKYKMNLGFIVFDYIKGDMVDSSALYNFLGERTNFLKNNVAGDLNIPILAGAQLNRNNQVSDSDKLERYASVSMLWREKNDEELRNDGVDGGNYCLNINLNRLGEQMMEDEHINFNFNGNVMRINEAKVSKPLECDDTPFDE